MKMFFKSMGCKLVFGILIILLCMIAGVVFNIELPIAIMNFIINSYIFDKIERWVEYNRLFLSNKLKIQFNGEYYDLYCNYNIRNLKLFVNTPISIYLICFGLIGNKFLYGIPMFTQAFLFIILSIVAGCIALILTGVLDTRNRIISYIIAKRKQQFIGSFSSKELEIIGDLK